MGFNSGFKGLIENISTYFSSVASSHSRQPEF